MKIIIKYILLDLIRNKTILVYTCLLAAISISILSTGGNTSKGLLSLLNITLLFVPIISILFATIYFFNSTEFTELLLAHPIRRRSMLMAEYTAVAFALSIAYLIGFGIPLLVLGTGNAAVILIISGIFLTLIFTALSILIFVLFRDKTKGIGASIIIALFFTLLFDGLLLSFIYSFSEYPIDTAILGFISLNPVDLARILVLLQLDVAVMMGYSGALFKKFLGSETGSIYSIICMLLWITIPIFVSLKMFKKKDL